MTRHAFPSQSGTNLGAGALMLGMVETVGMGNARLADPVVVDAVDKTDT